MSCLRKPCRPYFFGGLFKHFCGHPNFFSSYFRIFLMTFVLSYIKSYYFFFFFKVCLPTDPKNIEMFPEHDIYFFSSPKPKAHMVSL